MQGGAARLLAEAGLDSARLSADIDAILSQPDLAQRMSQAALAQARPDATAALVMLVEKLAPFGKVT